VSAKRRKIGNREIELEKGSNTSFHNTIEDQSRTKLEIYQDNVIGKRSLWETFKYEIFTGLLTDIPGITGIYLRQKIYKTIMGKLGDGVIIGKGVIFWQPVKIFIKENTILRDYAYLSVRGGTESRVLIGKNALVGRYSSIKVRGGIVEIEDFADIGEFCRIGTTSKIKIGSYTLVAAYCYIGAGIHSFEHKDLPVVYQNIKMKGGVAIGRDVWLGTHVTVIDGVTIGDGAVVGAYSLVNKDIPPHSIVHGIPAKIVGKR